MPTQRRSAQPGLHNALLVPVLLAVIAVLVGSASARTQADTASEQARSADSFVESICVGTHFSYPDTPYGAKFDAVLDKLDRSGIRYVRDGSRAKELGERGISSTLPAYVPNNSNGDDTTIANIKARLKAELADGVPIFAVEGPNEPDLFWFRFKKSYKGHGYQQGMEGVAKGSRLFMQDLHAALKSDPATAQIPIYSPSMLMFTGGVDALGSVAPWVDASNVHWYLAGRHPENNGWGDKGYGSRTWVTDVYARALSADASVVGTEGGYANATNANAENVPEVVDGRYMPRLYLHAFKGGIQRFCKYEFLDEWPNEAKDNSEANFGMLRNDLSEKPSYRAITNLIALLEDPGVSFVPTSLDYELNGNTDDVYHTLLQKRDGTFYLALWLGKPSHDPQTGKGINVPNQNVTLTLATPINAARLHTLDDQGKMSTTEATISDGELPLTVRDEVMIVELASEAAPPTQPTQPTPLVPLTPRAYLPLLQR